MAFLYSPEYLKNRLRKYEKNSQFQETAVFTPKWPIANSQSFCGMMSLSERTSKDFNFASLQKLIQLISIIILPLTDCWALFFTRLENFLRNKDDSLVSHPLSNSKTNKKITYRSQSGRLFSIIGTSWPSKNYVKESGGWVLKLFDWSPSDEDYLDFAFFTSDILYAPASYEVAISRHDATKWDEAIEWELGSLKQNHTYKILRLPPGKKAFRTE